MSHELQSTDANAAIATGKILLAVLEKNCLTHKSSEEVEHDTDEMLAAMRVKHQDLTEREILQKAIKERAAVAAILKFEHDAVDRAFHGDGSVSNARRAMASN